MHPDKSSTSIPSRVSSGSQTGSHQLVIAEQDEICAKRRASAGTVYYGLMAKSGRGATRQSAPRPVAPSGGCRYLCVTATLWVTGSRGPITVG